LSLEVVVAETEVMPPEAVVEVEPVAILNKPLEV
jgi:hypothetical protein